MKLCLVCRRGGECLARKCGFGPIDQQCERLGSIDNESNLAQGKSKMDIIEMAKMYLGSNTTKTGADVLVRKLIEEVELWRDRYEAERQAHKATIDTALLRR
jgi:hypothetical protein